MQVPLANVIGTMRYERTLGVASCGSLETIASSSMFEFAKGQPVLQLDCEGFKSPAFVFLPSEDGSADATATSNKVVQCSRWYEVISNSIFNRHLEPKKCLTCVLFRLGTELSPCVCVCVSGRG